jgi:hypothetical protein
LVDYALWTPDVQNIDKTPWKEKILACGFSADGQFLAFGTANGTLVLTDRKVQDKIEIKKENRQIWCLEWSPITPEF